MKVMSNKSLLGKNTKTKRNKNYFNLISKIIVYNYITFLIYNAKISDNNVESGKVPRMLAAFPRKGNPLKKEFLRF
jgi:hypothetical protein